MPRVGQHEPHARVEEGELAEAVLQALEIEFDVLERLASGHEGDAGAAPVALADDLQGRFGIAVAEAHEMLLAVAPDGEVEPFGQRVDDADADAVESPRNLVDVAFLSVLEFPA